MLKCRLGLMYDGSGKGEVCVCMCEVSVRCVSV